MSGAREEGATVPGLVVTDELTPDQLAFLEDRIYEYNVGATGIDDGAVDDAEGAAASPSRSSLDMTIFGGGSSSCRPGDP